MTFSKEDKELLTVITVLGSILPIGLIVINFKTIVEALFGVGFLLAPALYYLMIFLAILAGIWILVRVARNAWRG